MRGWLRPVLDGHYSYIHLFRADLHRTGAQSVYEHFMHLSPSLTQIKQLPNISIFYLIKLV